MEQEIFIKIYINCSICLGKGVTEQNLRNTNICPGCKGAGKREHFVKINEFKKMLDDIDLKKD
jgi:DnaJ-class molecular chaperone